MTSIAGGIVSRVLFAIWGWGELNRLATELAERELPPPPLPPEEMRLDVMLARQFAYMINRAMPRGINIGIAFEKLPGGAPPPPPDPLMHMHVDRAGNQISCTQAFALQQDMSYVIVDQWESDDGSTRVSTVWMGKTPKIFETRVFSTVEMLHGNAIGCSTESQARAYHRQAIDAIRQFFPPES